MSITLYVPCDSSAVSVGADRVVNAIAQEAENAELKLRLFATVRAACIGLNRWLKS